MKGFRRINGVNWLSSVQIGIYYRDDGLKELRTDSKLPAHWKLVKNIVLNNNSA